MPFKLDVSLLQSQGAGGQVSPPFQLRSLPGTPSDEIVIEMPASPIRHSSQVGEQASWSPRLSNELQNVLDVRMEEPPLDGASSPTLLLRSAGNFRTPEQLEVLQIRRQWRQQWNLLRVEIPSAAMAENVAEEDIVVANSLWLRGMAQVPGQSWLSDDEDDDFTLMNWTPVGN